MNNIILVTLPLSSEAQAEFTAAAPGYQLHFLEQSDSLPPELTSQVVAIIGAPSPASLQSYPSLRWVQLSMAGVDRYTIPGVLPAGVQLSNASGAYGLAIAEHMTGGVLMLLKKLHLYRDQQFSGCWQSLGTVSSVWGAQVLVVGLGDIGGEFAQRMHALGAVVTGIRRTAAAPPPYLAAQYRLEQLDQLLPQMDIVALSLPGTDQTAGLFSRERLARMKPGAILLNVGRGSAVDSDALAEALASGRLGGAMLDVTNPEPLPSDHSLWQQPNAIITPHVSGGFTLPETHRRVVAICLANLRGFGAPGG